MFHPGSIAPYPLEAFSDGVFAIIVTLLVLELKAPALQDYGSVQATRQVKVSGIGSHEGEGYLS